MLTAPKFFNILFLVLVAQTLSAQRADTTSISPFKRYWTESRLVPKVGFGVQDTGYGEIGVQLHRIYVHPLSLASMGPYLTVDAVFETDETIIGPKLGYEFTAGLIGLAADVTYYSNFDRHDAVMVTPKAGLSLFGYANLFYGRNMFLSDFMFPEISRNRFSLIFNLNRDYFNIRDANRRAKGRG